MRATSVMLLALTLIVGCGAPDDAEVVREQGRKELSDVPVPQGYVLESATDDESHMVYGLPETHSIQPLPEVIAFYLEELPRRGWQNVDYRDERRTVEGTKPESTIEIRLEEPPGRRITIERVETPQ